VSVANFQVRRATVDDLVMLRRLWRLSGLPAGVLERRIGECQVVETAEGEVLGAVGLQVEGRHGLIHSEAYARPEIKDELRMRLWERIQTMARARDLLRLWVAEPGGMFWLEKGFEPAASQVIEQLPQALKPKSPGVGLTLKLQEERQIPKELQEQLALLQVAREGREQGQAKIRLLRAFAGLVVVVLCVIVVVAAYLAMRLAQHGPVR
jgi:N-acetylglutamate synthase-like GNAT family acetyltransferase